MFSVANCVLPVLPLGFFAPLIFYQNGTLLTADSYDNGTVRVQIEPGEQVTLSCYPGYFSDPQLNNTKFEAKCKAGQTLSK